MEKEEFLNEEKYKKSKKKIVFVALIIFILGLTLGVTLIRKGINAQGQTNSKYSDESKSSISNQLVIEKQNLESKKAELEAKGIEYSSFAKYTDGEVYELKLITNVLDPSFAYHKFDEYKNNSLTSKYCSLKNQLEDISSDFNKDFDSFDSIPYYMFGGFIIFATCMISGSIYMIAKRREIIAFSAQQVIPVAQEGMEKVAPTIGKVGKTISEEMAPAYGKIAQEISKGIKTGMGDVTKTYCKHCGGEIDSDSNFCPKCGKQIK